MKIHIITKHPFVSGFLSLSLSPWYLPVTQYVLLVPPFERYNDEAQILLRDPMGLSDDFLPGRCRDPSMYQKKKKKNEFRERRITSKDISKTSLVFICLFLSLSHTQKHGRTVDKETH